MKILIKYHSLHCLKLLSKRISLCREWFAYMRLDIKYYLLTKLYVIKYNVFGLGEGGEFNHKSLIE